jgi:subtilisin family serine protease
MRARVATCAFAASALLAAPAAVASRPVTVGYAAPSALRGLHVLERVAPLGVAEIAGADPARLRKRPGIRWVARPVVRAEQGAQASATAHARGAEIEWELAATRSNLVPEAIKRAASAITIAVVDTGADVLAPDLAIKSPVTYNVITGTASVRDTVGHGTFVASLAAGSVSNRQGVVGFGGDARLMVVQANRRSNVFTDVDEAAGIVWAVDHGARIVNLSIAGTQTSPAERAAVRYAVAHGVLLVASAGNTGEEGDQPSYPAALIGAHGLVVAASTESGGHASFSTSAAYVSIAAPGVHVLGATTETSSTATYPRALLAGAPGTYAFGTGTSYSAPQVAGAAALVWAADPGLTSDEVVEVLEQTAAGGGRWSPQLGWGVLDVAAAVARAGGAPPAQPPGGYQNPTASGYIRSIEAPSARSRSSMRS